MHTTTLHSAKKLPAPVSSSLPVTAAPPDRKKVLKSSHFFALPMTSNLDVLKKLGDFQHDLFRPPDHICGLDSSIVIDPPRFHITIGVVGLEDSPRKGQSSGSSKTVQSAVALVESLKPEIEHMLHGKKLQVVLDKMDIMRMEHPGPSDDEIFTNVLFVGPSTADSVPADKIRQVMDLVYKRLYDAGYITESRSSKVHCSILNTQYRKPQGERRPFSYSDVLRSPACNHLAPSPPLSTYSFHSQTSRHIDLGTVEVGEIQLYKMGSHNEKNEYISCGKVRFGSH